MMLAMLLNKETKPSETMIFKYRYNLIVSFSDSSSFVIINNFVTIVLKLIARSAEAVECANSFSADV